MKTKMDYRDSNCNDFCIHKEKGCMHVEKVKKKIDAFKSPKNFVVFYNIRIFYLEVL